MKKVLMSVVAIFLLTQNVFAEEPKEDEYGLRVNFRRIALDMSSTEVRNSEKYQDSSVSALSADSESFIKGVFDGVLEYEQADYQWNNSLFMEYGKKTIENSEGERTRNKSADQILLTTEYARKVWKYNDADVGPFGSLGYETQFTNNGDNAPKTKILRAKTGPKIWNGENIQDLYIAIVGEHDMTFEKDIDKFAFEIGGRYQYILRDGVTFRLEGYYRDYFSYSEYIGEDLKYDLNLVGRMDVRIKNTINLSPFISYRLAESRAAGVAGSSLMIGLSLSYNEIFKL